MEVVPSCKEALIAFFENILSLFHQVKDFTYIVSSYKAFPQILSPWKPPFPILGSNMALIKLTLFLI